jgi:RecA-family ATPase
MACAGTQASSLARLLAAAQPSRDSGPERAMRVLVELIGLERQGRQHELIERRKALRDLHRSLYDAYMAPR